MSAIYQANTPFIDSCYTKFPHTTLEASGLAVGLPAGQNGKFWSRTHEFRRRKSSLQNLVKLNMAVEKILRTRARIQMAFEYAKLNHKKVHFIGLVSDGGVHSYQSLERFLTAAQEFGLTENVYVHAFTDGRDCDPMSGKGFIQDLQNHMKISTGKLANRSRKIFLQWIEIRDGEREISLWCNGKWSRRNHQNPQKQLKNLMQKVLLMSFKTNYRFQKIITFQLLKLRKMM